MTRMTGYSARSTNPSGSTTNRVVDHTRRRYSAIMRPTAFWDAREPTRRLTNDIRIDSLRPSTVLPPVGIRIEQAMHVNDEVAHMGVVDGLLRLGLPCPISSGIVRINADDIE